MQIGLAIRRARELSGLRQDGLAYLIGCPRSYICKIENGKSVPQLEQIRRIAEALGTTASMLVRDAENFVPTQVPIEAVKFSKSLQ
jgi:transcriptional regulator with XRE-family HTH domain